MKDQILQSIQWDKERDNTKLPTPASSILFEVDNGAPILSESDSDTFHSTVQNSSTSIKELDLTSNLPSPIYVQECPTLKPLMM